MDHRDPGAARVERAAQGQSLAVERDRAAVGLQHARQRAQQRRFARAVFAEQRVNLARTYPQRHVAERFNAGKRLGHMLDIEPQRGISHGGHHHEEERLPVSAAAAVGLLAGLGVLFEDGPDIDALALVALDIVLGDQGLRRRDHAGQAFLGERCGAPPPSRLRP